MQARILTALRKAAQGGVITGVFGSLLNEIIYNIDTRNTLNKSDINKKKYAAISIAISQSFQDVGFKGPVYVIFKKFPDWNPNVYVKPLIKDWQRSALVTVDPRFLKNKTEINMYALAGPLAINILHEHKLLNNFANGFLVGFAMTLFTLSEFTPARLGLLCAYMAIHKWTIDPSIGRLKIRDADMTSAKKLGTSDLLVGNFLNVGAYYAKTLPVEKLEEHKFNYSQKYSERPQSLYDYLKKLSPTHPSLLERCIYLKKSWISQSQSSIF